MPVRGVAYLPMVPFFIYVTVTDIAVKLKNVGAGAQGLDHPRSGKPRGALDALAIHPLRRWIGRIIRPSVRPDGVLQLG